MDFKTEDGGRIKPDPDASPAAMVEDYSYEDTGELEFPRAQQTAWLLRLPKNLHKHWAETELDEPIQIGLIRHFKPSGNMQLWLNPKANPPNVPEQYNIKSVAKKSQNTYVFSEKDLPGFSSKGKSGGQFKRDDKKDVLGPSQAGVAKDQPYERFTRHRKAIPKQTALLGAIAQEFSASAVNLENNAQSRRIDAEDRRGINILTGDVRQYSKMVLNPASAPSHRSRAAFDTFKTDSNTTKAKGQENKTARMAQNELLDLIFECFKDYRYWSMTALRQRLHQPEAYLRQTLLMIGEQVKSGPFNNHWKLKNESQIDNVDLDAIKDSSAPQQEIGEGGGMTSAAGSDDDDDDDDDDDVMEDVGI